MWCKHCHYGSLAYTPAPLSSCPQCGKRDFIPPRTTESGELKSPVSHKPSGHGSGNPTGKTKRKAAAKNFHPNPEVSPS